MRHDYDVIIIGSGIAGTIMASILARHGGRVCVIDAFSHPRYTIGESTIPQTSQMLSLIARAYDVPEVEYIGLGAPQGIRKHISSKCGIKRVFGFAYHQLGKEHDPTEAHQFGNIFRDENHLFRQDIDAYLAQVAVRYGADLLQNTRIEDLEIDDHGVTVKTSTGKTLTAQYIVDGSGYRSVVAGKYGLREEPCRFTHKSRTIFTHMIDVKPFEQVAPKHLSIDWSLGTLHHLFEGGWLWVIPFNNHAASTNDLVSVGLSLDTDKHPKDPAVDPEQEFRSFIDQYLPSAAKQFTDAKAMQHWVSTGRLQYSSSSMVGPRYCLMNHAAGFLDALYSRGLVNTCEAIRALAAPLLEAIQDGDWSAERFAFMQGLNDRMFDYADRLVHASYVSWSSFEVWDWTVRIWATAVGVAESNLGSSLLMGDRANFQRPTNPLFSDFEDAGFRPYFEICEKALLAYEKRELSASETAARLRQALEDYQFVMKMPDGSRGIEWAIKAPLCRDWYIGNDACEKRWAAHEPDPHLIGVTV